MLSERKAKSICPSGKINSALGNGGRQNIEVVAPHSGRQEEGREEEEVEEHGGVFGTRTLEKLRK